MAQEVVDYIEGLRGKAGQEWQADVCASLREAVLKAVPEATEQLQYGKPHFLKNGKYAAVVSAAKAAVSLTIFNATEVQEPSVGFFESGPAERKTVKIKGGQQPDYELLSKLVGQAAVTI